MVSSDVWARALVCLLQLGVRALDALDAGRAAAFRASLGADALGVLGNQLGKDQLDTVYADSRKPEDRGA